MIIVLVSITDPIDATPGHAPGQALPLIVAGKRSIVPEAGIKERDK